MAQVLNPVQIGNTAAVSIESLSLQTVNQTPIQRKTWKTCRSDYARIPFDIASNKNGVFPKAGKIAGMLFTTHMLPKSARACDVNDPKAAATVFISPSTLLEWRFTCLLFLRLDRSLSSDSGYRVTHASFGKVATTILALCLSQKLIHGLPTNFPSPVHECTIHHVVADLVMLSSIQAINLDPVWLQHIPVVVARFGSLLGSEGNRQLHRMCWLARELITPDH